ncbi:MAG: phage holin family protein [Thermaerobacter sp.]|nr:phage holin family protein [Thermaerobacter sp.]
MTYFGTVVRFSLAVIVLSLIGYIIPGFGHLTFGEAVLAAIVIGVLGYGIQIFLGPKNSTFVRGFIGFIVAGVVIWLGQFVLRHVHVSLPAALLAAAVIGLINYSIPNATA